MRMRRFTRLTNGFSKKVENLEHSVALHFFVYNFITCHMSLRLPPALKAGVTDHVWTFEELVEMIDRSETAQKIEYFQTETLPKSKCYRKLGPAISAASLPLDSQCGESFSRVHCRRSPLRQQYPPVTHRTPVQDASHVK